MRNLSISREAITGIILAGGRSSRMGQDKALLMLQGQTLLTRTSALLSSWGCAKVCVSGHYPELPSIPDNGEGPLSGILACLEHEPAPVLLFIPVDMPFMTSHYLDLLFNALRTREDLPGVSFADARFPLLLTNNARIRNTLTALLAAGKRTPLSLYERLGVLQLPLDMQDRPAFDNTNTPEQWQAALRRTETD
jgi:molybdopterin-guanine dinucleotide biosynthesis protein A